MPVNPDNDLLLSYSEGFRAPSFNDLYYPQTQYSNPNLQPENLEKLRTAMAQPTE